MDKELTPTQELVASRYKTRSGEPFILSPGQCEIFECIAAKKYPRVHCMCYTQYGKSDTVSMAALTRATTFPERTAIIAPSNKKANIIMSYLIGHAFDNEYTMAMLEVQDGDSLEKLRIERSRDRLNFKLPCGNISEVYTLSAEGKRVTDLLDALMGFGADNVIIDESSLIVDAAYAGIKRMVGGVSDGFIFEIGNPFRRNHFMRTSRDPIYHKIRIDYEQGIKEGRIHPEFIEEMRKEAMFDVLYENKFPSAERVDDKGYYPLITDREIERVLAEDVPMIGASIYGCDLAGTGKNYTTIVRRTTTGAKVLRRDLNPDTMSLVSDVVSIAEDHLKRSECCGFVVDSNGVGRGAYDRLKEIFMDDKYCNVTLIGLNVGERADNPNRFINKRAELFTRAAEWIKGGNKLSKDPMWFEMESIRFKLQTDRKIKIISKEELMKAKIESPDVADAFSLTFQILDLQEKINIKAERALEQRVIRAHRIRG